MTKKQALDLVIDIACRSVLRDAMASAETEEELSDLLKAVDGANPEAALAFVGVRAFAHKGMSKAHEIRDLYDAVKTLRAQGETGTRSG